MDKLQVRDEKCKIQDTDGFLSKAKQGIKRTLANSVFDQISSATLLRERRQISESIENFES